MAGSRSRLASRVDRRHLHAGRHAVAARPRDTASGEGVLLHALPESGRRCGRLFRSTFTAQALALIEKNLRNPAWAIPRHLKLTVPRDAKRPLSSEQTTSLGPFYDPAQDKMLGGIINTFSNTAFAETTFGLISMQKRVGSARDLDRRSVLNRAAVDEWLERHPLFEHGVSDKARRGTAVTLLRVKDPDITDPAVHASIVAKTKQLLGYEGLTHPDGSYEPGLDVARYVNAFPGTPGDFRAWIGGTRPVSDIVALLD